MKARSRFEMRGPTNASTPSANAVSVDIATPQPSADEVPMLNARKIATGMVIPNSAASAGSGTRWRSRSSPRSNSRRASRPTTKKKIAISPSLIHVRRSSLMPCEPSWIESCVVQTSWYEPEATFAQTSAPSVATSRNVAPPVSVVR